MAQTILEIEKWAIPKWHADFGDPIIEFNLLKGFCSVLLIRYSSIVVKLDCYEEGYMNVDIFSDTKKKIAELHVADTEECSYGLFFTTDGEEFYFRDKDEGIRFLSRYM